MNIGHAYSKFKREFPDLIVLSCYEYESCFVFHALPSEYVGSDKENMAFDSLYAVQKDAGEMSLFDPLDIPEEEYNSGKKLSVDKIDSMMNVTVNDLSDSDLEVAMRWLNGRRSS